ncbi:MAG: AAA family ATPase [Anaerolineae bacterium]
MPVTIAVINEKGGVGKTTTAITVAAGLARRGLTVCLVDADPQGHVAKYLGMPEEAGLFDLLVNDRPIASLLRPVPPEKWADADSDHNGQLVILPGNHRTTSAGHLLTAEQAPATILRDRLAPLRGADVIVMDTSPTVTLLVAMIYVAADRILIPTQPELGSVNGVTKAMARIKTARERGATVRLMGVVPLMLRRTTEHRANLAELVRLLEPEVWEEYENAADQVHDDEENFSIVRFLLSRHHDGQVGLLFSPIAQSTIWPETPAYSTTIFNYVPPGNKARLAAERLVDQVEQKLRGGVNNGKTA